jgi:hypothetical protein
MYRSNVLHGPVPLTMADLQARRAREWVAFGEDLAVDEKEGREGGGGFGCGGGGGGGLPDEGVRSHAPPRRGGRSKRPRGNGAGGMPMGEDGADEEDEELPAAQQRDDYDEEGGGGGRGAVAAVEEEEDGEQEEEEAVPPVDEGEAPKVKAIVRSALLAPILEAWHGPAAMASGGLVLGLGGGVGGGGAAAAAASASASAVAAAGPTAPTTQLEQGDVAHCASSLGAALDALRGAVADGDARTAAARDAALSKARRTHQRMAQLRAALEVQAARFAGLGPPPLGGEGEEDGGGF